MAYYTEIARHPDGFVLFARAARETHAWVTLKLMRPTGRSRRIWLAWNMEERRLGAGSSEQQLAEELPKIHDWVIEVLSAAR